MVVVKEEDEGEKGWLVVDKNANSSYVVSR
jgi:hypothetical protein